MIGLLLGALAGGCRASNVGLGAGDGGQAVTPEWPVRPPVIPNLDASPASDAAAANPAPPPADGSTPAPDGAPTAPPDATTVDATTTPPAADAARSDVASPVDAPTAPGVPDGCGIVTCDGVATRRDCCRAWYFFALESEDCNYVQRDALVTSFTKGADVRATYAFDRAGQDGAVGMLLDSPRRPTTIRVTSQSGGAAAQPPYVTVEGANGSAGCGYALGAGGLADLVRPLHCWGSQTVIPDRINIRIRARGPGPANIRVTAMEVR